MNVEERAKIGKQASATGFANESRLLAALLDRGFNASSVDLPHSTYDIVVELDQNSIIRVQAKTVDKNNSISFTGGARGGVDREYRSDVKSYTQNRTTSDIVVGVKSKKVNGDDKIDYYFLPTLIIEQLEQKSISANKVERWKNKWEILRECKNREFVQRIFESLLKPKKS
ncbi:MAG: hypothetical protein OXC03_05070 [Flavobacteriaceae bacterium]|nr:hypothetical protein [Flavobacteriaceae bacterium]